MRAEEILFTGGPLNGRRLPVLLGLNGRPPKTYEIPVPGSADEPGTVHIYRLQAAELTRRLRLPRRWSYAYDPEGTRRSGLRPPWTRSPRGGPAE